MITGVIIDGCRFGSVMTNRRAVRLETVPGGNERWTVNGNPFKTQTVPTRDMIRAVYVSEHERGRIAFEVPADAGKRKIAFEAARVHARIVRE